MRISRLALALNVGIGCKWCTTVRYQCNSTEDATQTHFFKYLVVESTHMQGGVSRCILGAHVSSVEQQVFQVLHVAIAACLKGQIHTFSLFTYNKVKREQSAVSLR